MSSTTEIIARLVTELNSQRGFLQQSPLRTGVWRSYIESPGSEAQLLLIPLRSTTAGKLCVAINHVIADLSELDWCTYNQSVVRGVFDFHTLATRVLPLSRWWQTKIEGEIDDVLAIDSLKSKHPQFAAIKVDLSQPRASGRSSGFSPEMLWAIRMLGVVSGLQKVKSKKASWPTEQQQIAASARVFRAARAIHAGKIESQLFAVSQNRGCVPCLDKSVRTIKGDASREVFDIKCNRLTWAVIDSGIDRNHPAFAGSNRIKESLDFTRLGAMQRLATSPDEDDRRQLLDEFGLSDSQVRKITRGIDSGAEVDWELLTSALRINPGDAAYFDRLDPHGTQVAGILGGEDADDQPPGVCPDINFIDIRVLRDAAGDDDTEFHIMSALQYVHWLNRNKDKPVVHGVNLSLSLPHSVTDYGCGHTPICEECDRLVSSGVVVVAAAGNFGFNLLDLSGPAETGGYRGLSITDPGNAKSVITVGSTHGTYPHRFGVSFFSSRGPTGDGRAKPDLVAPGESILCASRNKTYERCSGTSMSAPHVSGAAALLMARHSGLVGDPERVKQVLCETATDLQRNIDNQGHGLVDTLRALQAL